MAREKKKRAAALAEPAPVLAGAATSWSARLLLLCETHGGFIALALVVLATLRIAATYPILSYTFDEPAHLAAGLEWIEKHRYTYDRQHPPLARVMAALLPWLAGFGGAGKPDMYGEGLAIFGQGMDRALLLARAGMLPFFWIASWTVFAFTRWLSGRKSAAVFAVLLMTMTPTVLAHAGLATTDTALTGLLLAAIYAGWRWLWDDTSLRWAAWFGIALGLATLTKLSPLAFLPPVAAVALAGAWAARRGAARPVFDGGVSVGARAGQLGAAAVLFVLLVWAAYWFSFGAAPNLGFPVPAPDFFRAIHEARIHDQAGHPTYLLGAANNRGWPSFYLLGLLFKMPVPLLVLGLAGLLWLCRRTAIGGRGWILPSLVLGVLTFTSLFTSIRIGTRHVLIVYVALAMAGGWASAALLQRYAGRRMFEWPVAVLLVWMCLSSLAAHPDYLGYFNFLAGSRPEQVLVDSDLDWGQDVKRLAQRLKAHGATEVYFNQHAPGDLQKLFGFPPVRPLDFNGPQPGWNAVSVTTLKYGLFGDTRYEYPAGMKFWPDLLEPVERVGSGILLFYRAPSNNANTNNVPPLR